MASSLALLRLETGSLPLTDHTADGAAAFLSPTKIALRRAALAARDRLDASRRAEVALRLIDFVGLIDAAPGAVVSGFWPIRSEIDPRPLMERLAARGHGLALPVVLDDGVTLIFRRWVPGEALAPAPFGLSQPTADAPEVDPDVLLMPLAAFDRRGHRIGYGGGFYDRVLERLEATGPRRKIGLAFATQEVGHVPDEPHDRRLDLILTEDGPIVPPGDPT